MEIETIPKGNSVAEIELSYRPILKLSALSKVQRSEEIYRLLIETWDKTKLEFVEQIVYLEYVRLQPAVLPARLLIRD